MTVFVILHYMALDETITCVDSISNNVQGECKIIVVDNASPNGSINGLIEQYKDNPKVEVIGTERNLGFANGNNYGYRYAIEKYNPDFVVVMNNDMEIKQADFISKTIKCYEEYEFYIMGPDIYSTKKHYHQNPQTRKLPTLEELRQAYRSLWIKDKMRFFIRLKWIVKGTSQTGIENRDRIDNYVDEIVMNPMLHGSCYVFSKAYLLKHPKECFYSKTFMYMEAEILYYQALRDGELMIYCPDIHVDHHEDVATDAAFKKQYKKSFFSIQCLLQSTGEFIKLMEKDGIR